MTLKRNDILITMLATFVVGMLLYGSLAKADYVGSRECWIFKLCDEEGDCWTDGNCDTCLGEGSDYYCVVTLSVECEATVVSDGCGKKVDGICIWNGAGYACSQTELEDEFCPRTDCVDRSITP